MKSTSSKANTSIRINPEALHQARIAAVTAKTPLGQWLEEAIAEKIGVLGAGAMGGIVSIGLHRAG